ncbi:MAG: cupredoxin domain-containing protein [Longimicrobiales bacterium]
MVDSNVVLFGQTLAYTLYCLAMILLMAWFSYRVTRGEQSSPVRPVFFYSFVGFLTALGVSLHIITYNTIPWSAMDLNRGDYTPDRTFSITVADHAFRLPSDRLLINCGETVLFDVTSSDLTYGFGLFRSDHSMVFQMQVVPGHRNDILWKFEKAGVYSIRSTEYSGPRGVRMVVENAVEVGRCEPLTASLPLQTG